MVCTANPQLNSAGYVVVPLGPNGTAFTVPDQTRVGNIAIQTCNRSVEGHGEQLQMVLVPSFEVVSAHMAVPMQTVAEVVPIQTFTSEHQEEHLDMVSLPLLKL